MKLEKIRSITVIKVRLEESQL